MNVGSLRNFRFRPSKGFPPLDASAEGSMNPCDTDFVICFISSHMYQGHRLHASSMPHVGVRDGKEGHSLRDSPKEKMDRKKKE